MGKRIAAEIKAEIIRKIEGGRSVAEVAAEHGVNEKTVYRWVAKKSRGGRVDVLEAGRLRRENEALFRIIGQLTFEKQLREKKGSN
jgi:transposase-like protein